MSDHQVIPAEAVEEAVTFIREASGIRPDRDYVRAVLEAAAPHIRAQALEEVAAELDGADRVTRERDGYTATISLPNAAIYLRRRAETEWPAK